jgi:hypothetical protein
MLIKRDITERTASVEPMAWVNEKGWTMIMTVTSMKDGDKMCVWRKTDNDGLPFYQACPSGKAPSEKDSSYYSLAALLRTIGGVFSAV